MEAAQIARALKAVRTMAASLDLRADDAIVLHNSNKLTLRLLPCDVLARVSPEAQQNAQFEVDLARRLAASGCPVAVLDPRVAPRPYARDGFVITWWTYYESAPPTEILAGDYAAALEELHAGMRTLDFPVPHFEQRIDEARRLVANHDDSPSLTDADRELLGRTLRDLRRQIGERDAAEQLLHGEPHPGNVLATEHGLMFVDLETCCRGPVEFDLAHAPVDVAQQYPGLDPHLLHDCRLLMLAMVTAWRWDRGDQLPNGRQLGVEWLGQIRAAVG